MSNRAKEVVGNYSPKSSKRSSPSASSSKRSSSPSSSKRSSSPSSSKRSSSPSSSKRSSSPSSKRSSSPALAPSSSSSSSSIPTVKIKAMKKSSSSKKNNHDSNEGKSDRLKGLLSFLEKVPSKYKEGKWSIFSYLIIFSLLSFLIYTYPSARDAFVAPPSIEWIEQDHNHIWLQKFRLYVALYCIGIVTGLVYEAGIWPLFSYTILSWNLTIARLLFAYATYENVLGLKDIWGLLSQALRFPALVGCTITVTVWWLVLTPLIHSLLDDYNKRIGFWKFNLSFMLVNVHLFNIIIAAVEYLYSKESLLNFFDLWISFVVVLAYMLFYLLYLDARGLHFYIIFTPRTPFCVITYSSVLLIYYQFWKLWIYIKG